MLERIMSNVFAFLTAYPNLYGPTTSRPSRWKWTLRLFEEFLIYCNLSNPKHPASALFFLEIQLHAALLFCVSVLYPRLLIYPLSPLFFFFFLFVRFGSSTNSLSLSRTFSGPANQSIIRLVIVILYIPLPSLVCVVSSLSSRLTQTMNPVIVH